MGQGVEKNIMERAYELAPECSSTKELSDKLRREGFELVASHLSGLGTQRELRKLYNQGQGSKKRGPKPRSPLS